MMEVEAKIALTPEQLDALRSRLGLPSATHRQRDIYMKTAGLPVALRIREDDETAFVTLKTGFRMVGGIKVREELEPTIRPDEIPAWLRVFECLGLPRGLEVAKSRESYDRGDYHVLLDTVEHLGTFAEIEALAEEPEAALAKLEAAIAELGLADAPRITESYRELLAKKLGL
jgi:predicted adenylyl cyclase CyaB